MTWNTEYAHDLSILSLEEIGTFKEVPVYPTLFVKLSDIISSIGQLRPSGLSYSNNVLSVIISIYCGIILAFKRKNNRINYSDLILSMVIVLSGSLTSLITPVVLIILLTIYGEKSRRIFLRKFTMLLIAGYVTYSFLFPGIFYSVFSYASIWDSLLLRIIDISLVLGYSDYLLSLFSEQVSIIGWKYSDDLDSTYSGISMILKSRFIILLGFMTLLIGILYWNKFKRFKSLNNEYSLVYIFTLISCLITQFGVSYFNAPIFQILIGFSFYPVFSSYRSFKRNNNNVNLFGFK
jgi:hypothetical protein